MIPIHELLNRICWDREFGKGIFEIGYYDRMEQKNIRVSFEKVLLDKLPDVLDDKQKKDKVRNILQKLRRSGIIKMIERKWQLSDSG